MANRKVVLQRYIKTTGKDWHRFRIEPEPVLSGRGFAGKWQNWKELKTYGPKCVALGPFGLKWYVGGKAKYARVGNDDTEPDLKEALNAKLAKEKRLSAVCEAEKAGAKLVNDQPETTLLQAKKDFIRRKEAKKLDPETISAYDHLITEFLSVSGKRYAEEITDEDMGEFCQALRKRGLSERTVMNYAGSVLTFIRGTKLIPGAKIEEFKEVIPKVEDPLPVTYTKHQYERLMAVITNERHRLFFRTLLMTGLREREATHLRWDNLDLDVGSVRIDPKQETVVEVQGEEKTITFRRKNRRPRFVAVPSELISKLKEWRERHSDTQFVFGTPKRSERTTGDLPDGHLLDALKRYAHIAGLNCGKCPQCRRTKGKRCGLWKLHRFRHSYATRILRSGMDPASVRDLLGHRDLAMTNKYIEVNDQVKDQVDAAFKGWD